MRNIGHNSALNPQIATNGYTTAGSFIPEPNQAIIRQHAPNVAAVTVNHIASALIVIMSGSGQAALTSQCPFLSLAVTALSKIMPAF